MDGGDLVTEAAATIDGIVPEFWFGACVDGAGDLDGDGLSDLVVGGDPGGWRVVDPPGSAHVFLSLPTGHIDASHATTTFTAEWDRQRVGSEVAGVGDIDGDGIDDLLVSATCDVETDDLDSVGTAFLFSGALWR